MFVDFLEGVFNLDIVNRFYYKMFFLHLHTKIVNVIHNVQDTGSGSVLIGKNHFKKIDTNETKRFENIILFR